MGIRNFLSKGAREIAAGIDGKQARRLLPHELHRNALKKLQILRAAKQLEDLTFFPGLKLEKLKSKRSKQYSIRINNQYRVCFKWAGGDAIDVEIEDYH